MKMRLLAWFLLSAGTLLLVSNVRDEMRGETTIYGRGFATRSSANYLGHKASIDDEKSNFRGAMNHKWIYAGSIFLAGCFALSVIRHHDRCDPFSPDLKWPDDNQ